MDAVVAARTKNAHLWDRDPHDWYVESPECSRMLFQIERFEGTVLDPACGLGRIVVEAQAAGLYAWGSDLISRSEHCMFERNFLTETDTQHPDNIVSNPPFKHCNKNGRFEFVRRCLAEARRKVALLMPADWHCGVAVSKFLDEFPLYRCHVIVPRPAMPPGHLLEDYAMQRKLKGGRQNYAWYVWLKGYDGPGPFSYCRISDHHPKGEKQDG